MVRAPNPSRLTVCLVRIIPWLRTQLLRCPIQAVPGILKRSREPSKSLSVIFCFGLDAFGKFVCSGRESKIPAPRFERVHRNASREQKKRDCSDQGFHEDSSFPQLYVDYTINSHYAAIDPLTMPVGQITPSTGG